MEKPNLCNHIKTLLKQHRRMLAIRNCASNLSECSKGDVKLRTLRKEIHQNTVAFVKDAGGDSSLHEISLYILSNDKSHMHNHITMTVAADKLLKRYTALRDVKGKKG